MPSHDQTVTIFFELETAKVRCENVSKLSYANRNAPNWISLGDDGTTADGEDRSVERYLKPSECIIYSQCTDTLILLVSTKTSHKVVCVCVLVLCQKCEN